MPSNIIPFLHLCHMLPFVMETQTPEISHNTDKLASRIALEEYFSRVSIFSNSHPEISKNTVGYNNLVPNGFPRGWELKHDNENVNHLTLEDSSQNKIIYCLRPEGFDGFVYEPRSTYDRYFPVTHLKEQLLFGIIPRSKEDYYLPHAPLPSRPIVRQYEDPFKDIAQSRLPIIDHRDINPNSAWVISQNNRGLQFSGQAILSHDIETDSSGVHIKKPRYDKETQIVFLPPEEIIPNRGGPTVAATIIALENRYQISDINHPLPFKPISFQEAEFTHRILDTTNLSSPTGGWRATELNGHTVDLPNYKLRSVNKRMGVSVGTSHTTDRGDIFQIREIGGGGAAIIPYFIDKGVLYVGVIKENRPTVSPNNPYFSVVRGFINPGDTPKITISHEISQEMQYDGNPADIASHLQHLGIASQDPDMFGLGGVSYYALSVDKDILEENDGKITIKPTRRANTEEYDKSSEKMWEKIIGAEFVPAEVALQSPCLFSIIATGRLLTSDLIPRP